MNTSSRNDGDDEMKEVAMPTVVQSLDQEECDSDHADDVEQKFQRSLTDARAITYALAYPTFDEDRRTYREPMGMFLPRPPGVHPWHPMYHRPNKKGLHHVRLLKLIESRITTIVTIAKQFASHPSTNTCGHNQRVERILALLAPQDRFMVLSAQPDTIPHRDIDDNVVVVPLQRAADIQLACLLATAQPSSVVGFVRTVVNGFIARLEPNNDAVIPLVHKLPFRAWMVDAWMTLYVRDHPLILKTMKTVDGFHAVVHALLLSEDATAAFPRHEDALLRLVVLDTLSLCFRRFNLNVGTNWEGSNDCRRFTDWAVIHNLDRINDAAPIVRVCTLLVYQAAPLSLLRAVRALAEKVDALTSGGGSVSQYAWLNDKLTPDTTDTDVPFMCDSYDAHVMIELIDLSLANTLIGRQMRAYTNWIQQDDVQRTLRLVFSDMEQSNHRMWSLLPSTHPFAATIARLFPVPPANVGGIVFNDRYKDFFWDTRDTDMLCAWRIAHLPWNAPERVQCAVEAIRMARVTDEYKDISRVEMLVGYWWDGSERDVVSLLPADTLQQLLVLCDGSDWLRSIKDRIRWIERQRVRLLQLSVFDAAPVVARLPRSCLHIIQQMVTDYIGPSDIDRLVITRHSIVRTLRSCCCTTLEFPLSHADLCAALRTLCKQIEANPQCESYAAMVQSTYQMLTSANTLTFREPFYAQVALLVRALDGGW